MLRRAFACLLIPCLAFAFSAFVEPSTAEARKSKKKKKAEEAAAAEAAKEKKAKWDVTAPPGDWQTVKVDTEELTWSDVDVHPDGETLVFDMLGDIFTVPLAGGTATPVLTGIDWSFQPKWSPDGERIAFISDRGGADNLWVMNADGSDLRAITEEKKNLVHNPSWSPDGQYLLGKKGFTSSRSIPAGEIWLFHIGGGGGMQLIERPNGDRDQKNIAEPVYSPDGRYVYFSQDTTPGLRWQYNKDSTGSIFDIRRLDTRTGEVTTSIRGAGGAIRPTPSPDGKTLAFVKRTPAMTSAIYLKDLETGRETALYDRLDRDLQETNGSHGNAAAIAWTPDSASLVFWAGGKLRRVEAASGATSVIPVRVEVEHRVLPALRYPVDVAPDDFDVRMLRWAQRSPDGSKIVFQALGRLWIRDAADSAEARPLTEQRGHFEYYPTFSRDGNTLAYVTWNDQELGSVRVLSLEDGSSRTVVDAPGIYIEPSFSPDGNSLVYRKITGGYLLSAEGSVEPGLYWVSTDGGASKKIRSSGFEPHFGAENDRVYFLDGSSDGASLTSIRLDGEDELEHAKGSKVTEARVSPDGRFIAFNEQYNAYITPFARTGKAISLSSGNSAMPTRQVSKRAGEFLHWSADSSRLSWSHGPILYDRELKDAFAFFDGAPEELPAPVENGLDLRFSHPTDRHGGKVALVGGRVVTMRDAGSTREVIEDGVVLIEGSRIAAVGSRSQIEVPADAEVIDTSGKTVLPGLVDVHAHGGQGRSEVVPQQNRQQYSNLSFGVTTIHDPSNDTSEIFAASEMQRAGLIVAPRIYSTGTILYGAKGPGYHAQIDSYEDALFHVRRLRDAGAISVKSYNQPRRDQRQQVIAAGRELGLMVVPEGGAKYQHNMTMVVDGHTGLEHAIPIAHAYDDVVQLWSQTEVGYSPTFGVAYGGLSGETYWYEHTNVWENERLMAFNPRYAVEPASIRRTKAPDHHYNHIDVARFAKRLNEAGVPVLIGAHGQREGLAAHWELWMMVQGGFTPWEALRGGTIDGAHYIGLDGDTGSIEEGKLADLMVVDGNPLEDIRQSEHVSYTVLGGRVYDSATMNQIHPEKIERSPFFFELPGGDTVHPATLLEVQAFAERHGWVH